VMRAKLPPDPEGASCRLPTEYKSRKPTPAATWPTLSSFGATSCDTPGPSRRDPNVISTGKSRARSARCSGTGHGLTLIRWTVVARNLFLLPNAAHRHGAAAMPKMQSWNGPDVPCTRCIRLRDPDFELRQVRSRPHCNGCERSSEIERDGRACRRSWRRRHLPGRLLCCQS
jgi:hypothetical protein